MVDDEELRFVILGGGGGAEIGKSGLIVSKCPWWFSKDWPGMKLAGARTGARKRRRKQEEIMCKREQIELWVKMSRSKGMVCKRAHMMKRSWKRRRVIWGLLGFLPAIHALQKLCGEKKKILKVQHEWPGAFWPESNTVKLLISGSHQTNGTHPFGGYKMCWTLTPWTQFLRGARSN